MFSFTRDDEGLRIAAYRMTTHKHNPYVGSFHSVQRTTLQSTIVSNFVQSRSGNVPLLRHSPPVTSLLGLKGLLKHDEIDPSKPLLTQVEISKGKRNPRINCTITSLRSIPVRIFELSSPDICEDSPTCPICLVPFEDGDELRNLHCSHCFHKKCIDIWLLGCMSPDNLDTTKCPKCRKSVNISTESQDISSFTFLRIGQQMNSLDHSPSQWDPQDDSSPSPIDDSPCVDSPEIDESEKESENNISNDNSTETKDMEPNKEDCTLGDSTLCGSNYSLCGVPLRF